MPVKEVLLLGNPLLREKSETVTDFDKIKPILLDLKDTITDAQKTYGMGRGIAAPQLRYLKKIIYIQKPNRSFYLVNPEIIWRSKETFDVWDSCFSVLASFFVNITRNKEIRVKYQNEIGETKIEEFMDDMSELLQHEIDHLDGILCSDHLQDPKNIVLKEEWEKRYRTPGIGM